MENNISRNWKDWSEMNRISIIISPRQHNFLLQLTIEQPNMFHCGSREGTSVRLNIPKSNIAQITDLISSNQSEGLWNECGRV